MFQITIHVYKDECAYCFYTLGSTDCLFICTKVLISSFMKEWELDKLKVVREKGITIGFIKIHDY